MNKKKIAIVVIAAIIINFSSTAIKALADEISKNQILITEEDSIEEVNQAVISKFSLYNSDKIDDYNEIFRMNYENIAAITNNGGRYVNSTIDKAIDGNFNTHWETGRPNSSEFTNEVVFKLKEVTTLNRIVYGARQESAKGKGFAKEVEIYSSLTDEEDDFRLISSGEYTGSTGDIVEIKFNSTEFKRIKFKFKKANEDWASASEFMFYKEDVVSDKMKKLFTDSTMSQVNNEFNNIEKINALEEEVKNHPLYSEFKEDIENAKLIVENKEVNYSDAKLSKFKDMNSDSLPLYDSLYKVNSNKIKSITTNGGQYADNSIDKTIDGDINTKWHSGKQNSDSFTNEVVIELNELTKLNRVVYTSPRGTNRGFAEAFDIYVSRTSKGDTFELVSSGSHKATQDSIEIRFSPTEFKRMKFVFKKGYENWACAAEFGLYTQDEIAEKMDRLFTDNTMSRVSEEFNTLEKVQSLEVEAKNHPFYEDYKEYLEDAKILLQENKIEATTAKVSRLEAYHNGKDHEYNEIYRMPNSNIVNISANGGVYPNSKLEYMIDDKTETHWETNKNNTADFTNEVIFTLDKAEVLNRIAFLARENRKGFPEEFEIYASETTKGDTFQLVARGSAQSTNDFLEFKFQPTKFKRIKFKFVKANIDRPFVAEFRFYKEDKVLDSIQNLFTNGLMNELSEEYNTLEKLEALENEAKEHPLKSLFTEEFELANKILKGELDTVKVITAEQHGDMVKHAKDNLKFGFGNNNQPTGISAKPGDVITVYVDADPTEPLPSLAFSQQEGSFANWLRTVNLRPGKNVITVPEIPKDNWYHHDVTKGGAIYIVNPYTSEEQSKAPVLRFSSGDKFPFLTEDTNEEEFKNYLIEYKKAIDEDIAKNPNVLDREVLDVFEFVSDHIVWTGTATGAYKAYIEQGVNPLDTIKSYNTHMKEIFRYYGLDGSNEQNDPKYIRENVRLAQPFGYMYAFTGHIGVQGDVMANHLIPFEERGPSWGLTHEIGHKMDVYERLYGEVTNNMLPMYMSAFYDKIDKRIPYESDVYKNVISENSNKYTEGGYFENLSVYWQLEMYKPGYWAELNKLYRERNISLGDENPNNVKMQYLIKFSSEVIGEDLSEYFARHGFEVNEETKQETSKYKKPDKKIWYLNDRKVNYKGDGFIQDTNLDVTLNRMEDGIKLEFNVDNSVKSDLLGYEILKDGELIGFTSTNSFVDTNVDATKNSKYEVIPYDINLGTGKAFIINSFGASIDLQKNKIVLKLGEEFNPIEYIKVLSYEGNDITSNVEVEQNVDTSKTGNYEVKYKISDKDIEVEKTVKVEVVSDYDYLSDQEWISVETEWGTPRRNTNIKGRVNGEIKDFEKGFGIHANGRITYDLSDKEYDYFEALLGVDMSIAEQNKSSIEFEIIADGKVLATTDVMKYADNMAYINIPVNGVQELVIKVNNAGNGNELDHGIIVNPKLTTNNGKPKITVNDKIYKIGETVNFNEGVTAKDAEDGDLTLNIEIVSNSYEEGKIGRFEVVYKVTDSDNNTTESKSYITVYEDYTIVKSKYGQFDKLNEYNEEFKVPVVSITNNGGNYPYSPLERAIDNNPNTHWETGNPNSSSFKNEVIFDLGEITEISRIAYAARKGGKGFAKKFEIYISTEAEGNDFRLAGKGEYNGNVNDVVEFRIDKTNARRVKFKFIEANQDWASIGEMSFYKVDTLSDKIDNLFTDNSKTEVSDSYNTLEKVQALREEVKNHLAANLFEENLIKAEEIIKAKFPTIAVEGITYVKLNSDFNLTSGVTANDQEDGDITSNITVNKNDFNINKSGEYIVTYTIIDNDGNKASKDRKIVVYSDSTYISDIEWESAVSGWKSVNKDSAVNSSNKIKLKVNGEIKEFDKGIGAATNAEIIYKLDGNYSNFSTYVGTDKNYNDNRTTIIFKIFADGEEVYTSDVIRRDSEAELVNIDVTGVKELKLVADDADGNGLGDFASWADTKLYTINSKPKLTIPKSISTKVGEEIDLNQDYSAIDSEDGDLTPNVEVTGEVNFNKPGKYLITYKVVDSDGNEVSKIRTVSVVNMEDYKYLTEYDWKSAKSGWGTIRKDKSVSNNVLRLTNEEGEGISYDRGIGTHATSTIIYDLSDKDYSYFTSFVGVDRAMYGSVGSISFEVYVDGEKQFDSGIMNSKDAMKYVEVDINGAKELKLVVTDGGNGIGSDHATWGDAKLHYANINR